MTKSRARLIPMGLTRDYASKWGVWEVVRELVANCKDADPSYQTFRREGDDNYLSLTTSTVPRLAEMIFLGCGHGAQDDKIGQFGEGFKLAALVATRTPRASLRFLTSQHIITFKFKTIRGFDIPVLMAKLSDNTHYPLPPSAAFKIELTMKGACTISEGKFLTDGSTTAAFTKSDPSERTRIYCRGIFITDLDTPRTTLYHYNLNSIKLNRDRSMVSGSDISLHAAQFLLYHMTDATADLLFANPACWENQAITDYGVPYKEEPKQKLAAAFRRRYGDTAVIATQNDSDNEVATLRGHRVIAIPPGLAAMISSLPATTDPNNIRPQTTKEVIPKDHKYTTIPNMSAHTAALAECAQILDILNIPAHLQIFGGDHKTCGLAIYNATTQTCTVWLNERLFAPGQRLERLRTLCHELAHIDTEGAPDLTTRFEYKLDEICGKLAMIALDLAKKPSLA